MRTKNYIAIYAVATMLLLSCQADADGSDIISDDSVVESTQGSDVVVVPLTLGGEQVSTTETTDASAVAETRVSLNPSASASFFWSSQEYFTAIDMTDDYHTSADTKLCEMAADISTVNNTALFTFDMSVQGLNTSLSTDVGKVNFYAYTPRREYNYRYHDMIKLAHVKVADTINYNGDFLLLNYPMDRIFNVDATSAITEAYHLYGRFLPFVAIPLRDKSVTWTKYDEDSYVEAIDDDGNPLYDDDGNQVYITGATTFSSEDKFNFAGVFHTVMIRIYPIGSDEDGHKMIDLDIHKSVATITLTDDGGNYFRTGDLFDLEKMSYNSNIPTMIDNARVSVSEDTRTFVDSDGLMVENFVTNTRTISSTIAYFSTNVNPTSVVYSSEGYTYAYEDGLTGARSNDLYDGSNHKTTISILDRIAEGNDYLVIPVIATRTYDRVSAFDVNIKFYDVDDNLILNIDRSVSDNSDTRDCWYYGSQSFVRIYEDPTEMGTGFGDFTFYE